jgi:hypothetical protein
VIPTALQRADLAHVEARFRPVTQPEDPWASQAARSREDWQASEMLAPEAEQGSTVIGCRRERHELLDYA